MSVESFKVVLVGESGVGKTSIITKFIDETFQEDQQSTTGGTFSTKSVICDGGKILKFEIWDTAGQERYRALTKMFYKDANAAIMVYDITRKDSFEELKNYWSEQIKESSPEGIILVIAANKSDLFEHEAIDESIAREFAQQIGAFYIATSAKNSDGINNLFEEIAKKYTGSSTITIKKDEGDEPAVEEEKKDTVKITQNQKAEQKGKKKGGFC
jgi:Ras-related protein Rab-22